MSLDEKMNIKGGYYWQFVDGKHQNLRVKRGGYDQHVLYLSNDCMGNDSITKSDADLIVAALNGCLSVNPSNPMAVAENIKEMYEALKLSHAFMAALEKQDPKRFNDPRVIMLQGSISSALAAIEAKG